MKITFLIGSILIAAGMALWASGADDLTTIALLVVGMFFALLALFRRHGRPGYTDAGYSGDSGGGE